MENESSIVVGIMSKEMLQSYVKIKSEDSFNYNMKILHIVNSAGNTITYQEAIGLIEEVKKNNDM